MLQERTIYIPTNVVRRTETSVKPLVTPKRKTIHINIESVKDKLLGVSLITVGMISAKLTGDGTAAVMCWLMGLSAIFSK